MPDVFLPKTDFPLRPSRATETDLRDRWSKRNPAWPDAEDLYKDRLARGGEPFVMHDGPPYANGNIHIGHALNKTLKDFVVRTRYLLGHAAQFTPGWDCHGLPIEWKVEEEFRAAGRDKNAEPEAFRQACRDFASKWVDVQRDEFERLGVLADWDNPYLTMDFKAEAKIVQTFQKIAAKGLVYSARKPVLWSAVEQTALASAETDDQEHDVPSAWVLFPISTGPMHGAFALVWTTTPWSLPGNRAIAFNPELKYALYAHNQKSILMEVSAASKLDLPFKFLRDVEAQEFAECGAESILNGWTVPFLAADYVTAEKGSGLVHVGPASSSDDWNLWKQHGMPMEDVPKFVGSDGRYTDMVGFGLADAAVVKNKRLGDANDRVLAYLTGANLLLSVQTQKMTLKHSWRSGALLFENATPQWFIDVSGVVANGDLADVRFSPAQSRNRFAAMLAGRTDWLVSRQRMWGTPLAIFANADGEVLHNEEIDRKVVFAIAKGGAEAWFTTDFGQPEGFEKVTDVLDVWFDSGCVHAMMGDEVADLYLEGSDQHRGWFQSSMLVSQLTQGRSPYREVLTHGFTLDTDGKKMSKSQRNGVDPMKLIDLHGADVVRLWVASVDYTNDIKVGPDTFKGVAEVYKKLRNTVRYLAGSLDGYVEDRSLRVGIEIEWDFLDRYAMYRLETVSDYCRVAAIEGDFTTYLTALHSFCVHDLSALYFDARKDRLYCDELASPLRQGCLRVMSEIFDVLVVLLAPILPYMAEEAWSVRHVGSVHLERWPESTPSHFVGGYRELAKALLAKRDECRTLVEEARTAGVIKGDGEAIVRGRVDLPLAYSGDISVWLQELLVVSAVIPDEGDLRVTKATDDGWAKCERCRLHYPELVTNDHKDCARCAKAREDFND